MAYAEVDDLLIGQMTIGPGVNKQKFLDQASEEMDAKLGFIYKLPLEAIDGLTPPDELPVHEKLVLKGINSKLASGRIILTLDIAEEGSTLHAYGLRLVTEAMNELLVLANAGVMLSAVRLNPVEEPDRRPAVKNRDAESAVDQWENTVMRGEPSYWNPGEVISRPYIDLRP